MHPPRAQLEIVYSAVEIGDDDDADMQSPRAQLEIIFSAVEIGEDDDADSGTAFRTQKIVKTSRSFEK
jgi:hypothetical protein